VTIAPFGTLSDYVPFYFTPATPMLLNIKTGRNGVVKRPMADIAILVTSLPRLVSDGVPFIFTNKHAHMQTRDYFRDVADLDKIDWAIIQRRDFHRDPEDPEKLERYQAEALVYRHLPVSSLIGIACYGQPECQRVREATEEAGLSIRVV